MLVFSMGVKEVKGLSIPERSGGMDRSEAETLDFRGASAPFLMRYIVSSLFCSAEENLQN
jgi:hypothetical protein